LRSRDATFRASRPRPFSGRLLARILVPVLAFVLATFAAWQLADRGLWLRDLRDTVDRVEVRQEKHPPVDNVHLVHLEGGDVLHVDADIANELGPGSRLRARAARSLTVDDRILERTPSHDLKAAAVVLPLMVLLVVLVACRGTSRHRGNTRLTR
jgi:hypothetical protein